MCIFWGQKKYCIWRDFSEKFQVLCKNPDEVTRFDGTVFNFGTYSTSGEPSVSVSDCASASASSSVGDPNSKLKKYCWKKLSFWSNIANDVQAKREHPAIKKMKYSNFSWFCGSFLLSWIRIRIQRPHWIRILSTTLASRRAVSL